jgi:hypothetical protein
VHGSGYERLASPGCPDATIRRRLEEWAAAGLSEQVHTLALQAYERIIRLDLNDLTVDGRIATAPCGGDVAGRSPVDRGKQGLHTPWRPTPPGSHYRSSRPRPIGTTPQVAPIVGRSYSS